MATVVTPAAAVDAIQRVPVLCWIGPWDDRNGFPNYPVWCDPTGNPVDTFDAATHVLWDGAFGAATVQLLAAIGTDPAKVPADTSALDRAALLELYALTDDQPADEVTP